MIVSMWMTREVLTIPPEMLVTDAARLMTRRRIRRLPVVTAGTGGEHLVGVLTLTDVLHAFPPDVNPFAVDTAAAQRTRTQVGDVVTHVPVTVAPDAPIEQAAALMRERKVGALPVVRDGKLVGLITESDVFRAFVSLFAARHPGVRVTFDESKCEHPFAVVAALASRHPVEVRSLVSSRQDSVPVCVVRLQGAGVQAFVDDLWKAGHRVLNVLPVGPAPATPAPQR